jgi:hypothetical protein
MHCSGQQCAGHFNSWHFLCLDLYPPTSVMSLMYHVLQEVAHILDHAGPNSLVLVDELGRATSTADGTALAWAVCEALLAARAPTLFATHFPALAQLALMYPAARLWQLRVRPLHLLMKSCLAGCHTSAIPDAVNSSRTGGRSPSAIDWTQLSHPFTGVLQPCAPGGHGR